MIRITIRRYTKIKAYYKKSLFFHLLVNIPNIIRIILKERSFTFFTLVNPGIAFGGMLGYSKSKINCQFDKKYKVNSIVINHNNVDEILHSMQEQDIYFPIIAKPDIGQRGKGVKYIKTRSELQEYIEIMKGVLIIEEYIASKEEYGVLYIKGPKAIHGKIASFSKKRGISETPVEKLNFSCISKQIQYEDLSAYVTSDLEQVFETIIDQIDEFYFGRFDIRANSIEDLINGKFKIIELNGFGSVPLHLYDPNLKFRYCYSYYRNYYNEALNIAKNNQNRGYESTSPRTFVTMLYKTNSLMNQYV